MFTAGMAVIATAGATHPPIESMTEEEMKFLGIEIPTTNNTDSE